MLSAAKYIYFADDDLFVFDIDSNYIIIHLFIKMSNVRTERKH